MAIRLRQIDGCWIAICAARSVEKLGDVYLDDGQHHALTVKFEADFAEEGLMRQVSAGEPELALMQAEESNNANRTWWDGVYGQG